MKTLISAAVLSLASAAAAGAQLVYNNDGSSLSNLSANSAIWSTPGNCTSATYCGSYIGAAGGAAGYNGTTGSGRTFGNTDDLTLALSGLGAHTGGTLTFTLFIIDSWDGD